MAPRIVHRNKIKDIKTTVMDNYDAEEVMETPAMKLEDIEFEERERKNLPRSG